MPPAQAGQWKTKTRVHFEQRSLKMQGSSRKERQSAWNRKTPPADPRMVKPFASPATPVWRCRVRVSRIFSPHQPGRTRNRRDGLPMTFFFHSTSHAFGWHPGLAKGWASVHGTLALVLALSATGPLEGADPGSDPVAIRVISAAYRQGVGAFCNKPARFTQGDLSRLIYPRLFSTQVAAIQRNERRSYSWHGSSHSLLGVPHVEQKHET